MKNFQFLILATMFLFLGKESISQVYVAPRNYGQQHHRLTEDSSNHLPLLGDTILYSNITRGGAMLVVDTGNLTRYGVYYLIAGAWRPLIDNNNINDYLGDYHEQDGNTRGVDAVLGTNDNFALLFETNNTVAGRFTNDGNLLLNTTNNTHKLRVNGTTRFDGSSSYLESTTGGRILLRHSADNDTLIEMRVSSGDSSGSLSLYNSSNAKTIMFTGGSGHNYINNTGNTLIGTTTSEVPYKLLTNGAVKNIGNYELNSGKLTFNNASTGILIDGLTFTNKKITIGKDNSGGGVSNVTTIGFSNTLGTSVLTFINGNDNNTSGTSAGAQTIIGWDNRFTTTAPYTIAIGSGNRILNMTDVSNNNDGRFVLGNNDSLRHDYSSIIGSGVVSTAKNQFIIGDSRNNADLQGYKEFWIGNGVNSRNISQNAFDVMISSSNAGLDSTNRKGGALTLQAGASSGNMTAQDIMFRTSTATASGNTPQTQSTRWWIKGETGTLSNISTPVGTPIQYTQSTTRFTRPIPAMTQAQRDAITPQAWEKVICTDCTADDASTGVEQTWNPNTTSWKNHW